LFVALEQSRIDYQLGPNYQAPACGGGRRTRRVDFAGQPLMGEERLMAVKKSGRKNPSPDNNDHERECARTSGVTFASRDRRNPAGVLALHLG
jgi:hypothetical protein